LKTAERALSAIKESGFAIVPKEHTAAMPAGPCDCAMTVTAKLQWSDDDYHLRLGPVVVGEVYQTEFSNGGWSGSVFNRRVNTWLLDSEAEAKAVVEAAAIRALKGGAA
jgi:hypothetical protein